MPSAHIDPADRENTCPDQHVQRHMEQKTDRKYTYVGNTFVEDALETILI